MSQDQQGREPYVLTGKGEILERLRIMERQKILVTAIPGGQSSGFITTIVKVLPEKGMLALDASPNPSLNADVMDAESVSFEAQVDGIAAHFTATEVCEATLDGQQVFAVPIPASLYWLQRRSFFRVPVLLSLRVKCRIPLTAEQVTEFDVLNLSLRGVAIQDRSNQFRAAADVGTHFSNCTLDAPGLKGEPFGLELRNIIQVKGLEGRSSSWRLGFEFSKLSGSFEVGLQKLIYELELQRKQTESLVRDKS